ncbi:hypothetical protein QFZ23_001575 [Arthrobacter globiformis]|nr:hypothetical protein [Arthrobacter globiformis]
MDALELHSHVATIGDVRSLVVHPASTTHSQLPPEQQGRAGSHTAVTFFAQMSDCFVNWATGHECQRQPRLAGRQPSFRGGVPRVKTWPAGQLPAGKRVEEVYL